MSYCSKRAPTIDSAIMPVGYSRSTSGVVTRNSAYDGPRQSLQDRKYSSLNTPGFKRVKKQVLAPLAFSSWSGVLTDSVGTCGSVSSQFYSKGVSRQVMGTSNAAVQAARSALWSVSTMNLRLKAEALMLERMKDVKFNAPLAFAERRQTANLLVHTVNRVATLAVLIRKGKFAEANRFLEGRKRFFAEGASDYYLREKLLFEKRNRKNGYFTKNTLRKPTYDDFTSAWLEYKYGWVPLLSDVKGAAELCAQSFNDIRPTSVYGKAETVFTTKNVYSTQGLTGTAYGKANSKYKAVCKFEVSSVVADKLKQTGIADPLVLAWEMLPYSFVVDWFVPVGQYLSNLSAPFGIRFISGSLSYKCDMNILGTSVSNNTYWWIDSGFPVSYDFAEVTRTVYTAFPSPQLPSLSLGLTGHQITSGIALISQLFRR